MLDFSTLMPTSIQQISQNQQSTLQSANKCANATMNRAYSIKQLPLLHQEVRHQMMHVILGHRTVDDYGDGSALPDWMSGICGGVLWYGYGLRSLLKGSSKYPGKFGKDTRAAQVCWKDGEVQEYGRRFHRWGISSWTWGRLTGSIPFYYRTCWKHRTTTAELAWSQQAHPKTLSLFLLPTSQLWTTEPNSNHTRLNTIKSHSGTQQHTQNCFCLLQMQGHINDPAPEHHNSDENGLYMKSVSYTIVVTSWHFTLSFGYQ